MATSLRPGSVHHIRSKSTMARSRSDKPTEPPCHCTAVGSSILDPRRCGRTSIPRPGGRTERQYQPHDCLRRGHGPRAVLPYWDSWETSSWATFSAADTLPESATSLEMACDWALPLAELSPWRSPITVFMLLSTSFRSDRRTAGPEMPWRSLTALFKADSAGGSEAWRLPLPPLATPRAWATTSESAVLAGCTAPWTRWLIDCAAPCESVVTVWVPLLALPPRLQPETAAARAIAAAISEVVRGITGSPRNGVNATCWPLG